MSTAGSAGGGCLPLEVSEHQPHTQLDGVAPEAGIAGPDGGLHASVFQLLAGFVGRIYGAVLKLVEVIADLEVETEMPFQHELITHAQRSEKTGGEVAVSITAPQCAA